MSENWLSKNWTIGEVNALIKNLGEENARRIQRGEVSIRLKEAIKALFDKTGRRIPQGLKANVCDPNRNFNLVQPTMTLEDYAVRLKRLQDYLGVDTGITAEEFKLEIERQLKLIQSDPQVANLAKGVCLPLILPKLGKLEMDNLGATLEEYLKAVGKSYAGVFPDRKFNNYREGELSGKVSVADSTRYNQLIKLMKQRPVIARYFPNSLQGYSVLAAREQMETLPQEFALSGLDTLIAMVMYPDILARDWYTPGLNLAALSWRSSGCSLYLRANVEFADFGAWGRLADASGDYSAGLVFFG